VAIISNSYDELQSTITSARKSTLLNLSNGKKLHADHAHFTCAIKLSSLFTLLSAGKTRSKNEMVTKDVLLQIKNDDGVTCLSSEMTNESTSVQIKMGHHLTSSKRCTQEEFLQQKKITQKHCNHTKRTWVKLRVDRGMKLLNLIMKGIAIIRTKLYSYGWTCN